MTNIPDRPMSLPAGRPAHDGPPAPDPPASRAAARSRTRPRSSADPTESGQSPDRQDPETPLASIIHLRRSGLRLARRLGPHGPVVRDLALQDRCHVFADRPVATVRLHQDPLEQVVRQVDRPPLDPLGRAGVDRPRFPRCSPPAPRRAGRLDVRRLAQPRRLGPLRVDRRRRVRRRRPLQDPRQPWTRSASSLGHGR